MREQNRGNVEDGETETEHEGEKKKKAAPINRVLYISYDIIIISFLV